MLSRLAKFLLVSSSVAPMLLTWALADFLVQGASLRQLIGLAAVALLTCGCLGVISAAKRLVAHSKIDAKALRSADTEVVGFLVAYLLPLITTRTDEFDYLVLAFVMGLVSVVVWSSNAYSVNPILSVFKYHFYQVTSADGVEFLLLSRRDLLRTSDVASVQQLTHYVLLDAELEDG